MLLALAVTALVATQDPSPYPYDEPAAGPAAEAAAAEAGAAAAAEEATGEPPLVELAPDPSAASPPAASPPAAPVPDPKASAAPSGMDQPALAAAQMAVGAGACCAGCCVSLPFTFGLALVPVVGGVAGSVVADLIVGGTIGVAETWAGDAWGKGRAPLLWPVAASAGILLASTAFSVVANVLEPTTVPVVDPNNPNAALQALAQPKGPLSTAASFVGLGACVGAVALPAIIYAFTATPKKPGDTGQGFPGFAAPADPVPGVVATVPAGGGTLAMRY